MGILTRSLIWMVITGVTTIAVTHLEAVPDPPAVEKFKRFLSATPVVENLVFSERLPPDPKAPWRVDIAITESQAFRYFQARWQPNGFFLREILSPTAILDVDSRGLVAARFEQQSWFREWNNSPRSEILQVSTDRHSSLDRTVTIISSVLRQVLTFGLMHSDIGTVEWRGNHFHVQHPTKKIQITGQLINSLTGYPETLRITYSDDRGDVHWIIRYGFEKSLLTEGLPSELLCFWLNKDHREIQLCEFSIYELKTRRESLGINSFSADMLATQNQWKVHLVTTNAVYAVLPGGEQHLIERFGKPLTTQRTHSASVKMAIAYSTWAAVNGWIFIFAVRMRKQRKIKKPNERKENL